MRGRLKSTLGALTAALLCAVCVSAEDSSEALLRFWSAQQPDCSVICTGTEDLNADGRKDLVVLYTIAPEVNRMRVVLNLPEGPQLTNEHPAPVSNQVIQFKNIDEKPPMEFIVFGSKGLKTGFAVYRYHHGTLEDLFAEDMHDCCN